MEDNWNEDLLYVIGVYSTYNKIAYLSYHVQRSHWLGQTPSVLTIYYTLLHNDETKQRLNQLQEP